MRRDSMDMLELAKDHLKSIIINDNVEKEDDSEEKSNNEEEQSYDYEEVKLILIKIDFVK